MIPWEIVDRVETPDGSPLALARRGEEWVIRAGTRTLMGSRMHASEEVLGARAGAHLAHHAGGRVLLGGLGMGFSLRAVLDALPDTGVVTVAELVPAVLRWNRGQLGALAGEPLRDPRVRVREGDVARVMAERPAAWDAIVLDVDNGPSAFTDAGNAGLYDDAGIARMHRALRPGGLVAVWSAGEDRGFHERLRRRGFAVTQERPRARVGGGGRHVLWLARRADVAAPALRSRAPARATVR